MKKILITGITGFVGSHLADFLLKETDDKIFGLKRPNSQLRNIHHILDQITLIDGDLIDQTSLIELIRNVTPDEIYHLGALSWVSPSWDMPSAYMQTNAIGTINLFEAMRVENSKAKVFLSCTPEEYGDVPKELIPITEETRIHPINPYAASKAAQDMVSMVYSSSYNFPIIRTRAFNHEGPRREKVFGISWYAYQIAMIENGLMEGPLKVGGIDDRRNFTHVRDIVEAYWISTEKCNPGELYLVGSEDDTSIYTFKEALEKLIKMSTVKKIDYVTEKEFVRPTSVPRLIADTKKFRDKTDWEPKKTFDDILIDTLEYWREKIKNNDHI